jgi:hypothetical protein
MDAGRIVLLGFEHVSLLPESLVSYTMHRTGDDFVRMVAQYLPLEQSPNIPTLSVARRLLHTHAGTTFGMSYPLIMEIWIDDRIRFERRRLPGS